MSSDLRFRGSFGSTHEGCDEFKRYVKEVQIAFPDWHNQIDEMLAVDDRVVTCQRPSRIPQGRPSNLPARSASNPSVRRAKVAKHREALDVARCELCVDLFGSGSDREVSYSDSGMAPAPAATEFPARRATASVTGTQSNRLNSLSAAFRSAERSPCNTSSRLISEQEAVLQDW